MATIRTTIQINDMMSQQFRAMNMAMMTVIDSFQTLEDVTGNAVVVSALNTAQRELQQVEANFNQIEREIKQAEHAQEKLNQDIHKADDLASNLLGTLGTIVGTYFTLQGLGNAISLSDEITNTVARLDMINDEMQTTEELQQMIFDSAKRSHAPYLEVTDLVGKLAMNASDAFGSTAETVAFAALRGEELNTVLEAAPGIVQNIEKYLNISRIELKEMASDGEITAKKVIYCCLWHNYFY